MHDIIYRRIHDLQELHDLLCNNGVETPEEISASVEWSLFAATLRYDDWPKPEAVDRPRAHELARAAIAWR